MLFIQFLLQKKLIQKLRDDGWDNLLENIVSFSKKYEIDILDLSARYIESRGCNQKNHTTVEHHYYFDIFNTTINFQFKSLIVSLVKRQRNFWYLTLLWIQKMLINSLKLTIYASLQRSIILLIFLSRRKLIWNISWGILNLMCLLIRHYKICLSLHNYAKDWQRQKIKDILSYW